MVLLPSTTNAKPVPPLYGRVMYGDLKFGEPTETAREGYID